MARYILKSGSNLLKSGNTILTSSDKVPDPVIDINPAAWGLSGGASVPTLYDSSGNSLNFQQTDTTRRGTLIANALDGFPAVQIDGVNDYYESPSPLPAKTIFVIVRAITNSSYRTLFAGTVGSFGYFVGGDPDSWFLPTSQYPGFGYYTENRLFVNGMLAAAPGIVKRTSYFVLLCLDIAHNTNANLYRIGCTNQTGAFFHGEYVRVIAYKDRLTEAHRIKKTNELLAEYPTLTA